MTDEQLCSWLESTGFPQASDAASRIRNKNIEISSLKSSDSGVTPPRRWPELGTVPEEPVLVSKPRRKTGS
jgi:hypothetical protein